MCVVGQGGQGFERLPQQRPRRGGFRLQPLQCAGQHGTAGIVDQARAERGCQGVGVVGEPEGRCRRGDGVHQERGRRRRIGGDEGQRIALHPFADRGRQLVAQRRHGAARRRQGIDRAGGPDAVDRLLRHRVAAAPPGDRKRTRGRRVPQGARGIAQGKEGAQDRGRVVVVDALLVAFAITRRGVLADDPVERFGIGQRVLQRLHAQSAFARQRVVQQTARKMLAAVERGRFGFEADVPVGAQCIQCRFLQRLQVVGTGQVHGQRVAARDQRQVQGLRVDAETVARTKTDDIAAIFEQVAAVAQRTHRLVARALDPCLDVVGLHRILQLAQAAGQLAQLQDQGVAGEEGVEFVRRGEALGTPTEALQDAVGRFLHRLRLALALVEQRLLVRLEGVQHLLALGQDVAEELFVFAELALQFLQLHHQAR